MFRSDEWNEFLFDLVRLPKSGKGGKGSDSCGVLSLRAHGRPVSEGIRGRPRTDKLSKAYRKKLHLHEDEKFRYGRMQSLNSHKRDSSEELEDQRSSFCSRWALSFVAEGGFNRYTRQLAVRGSAVPVLDGPWVQHNWWMVWSTLTDMRRWL